MPRVRRWLAVAGWYAEYVPFRVGWALTDGACWVILRAPIADSLKLHAVNFVAALHGLEAQ